MPEDGPLHPRSLYEISKQEGEEAVMALHGDNLEVSTLRPTLVYGPRSRYGFSVMIALFNLLKQKGITSVPVLLGGPLGHHVHVTDVSRAALLIATHPEAGGKSFNVADDKPLTLGETMRASVEAVGLGTMGIRAGSFADSIYALCRKVPGPAMNRFNDFLAKLHQREVERGHPAVLTPKIDPEWFIYFAGDHVYDTTRLKSLGFQALFPDFRRGLAQTIEWYIRNGWLPGNVTEPSQTRTAAAA